MYLLLTGNAIYAKMRDMEKAYWFRFYPTPEQESLLRRTLGCVRLVYNCLSLSLLDCSGKFT